MECLDVRKLGVRVLLIFLIAFGTGYQQQAIAADANNPDVFSSIHNRLEQLPERMWDESKYTFGKNENITALLLATGASIAMHNQTADDKIADNFEDHDVFDDFKFGDEALNIAGSPGTHFAVTGLWYALAVDSQNKIAQERAWTMMTALAVNGTVTLGLKAIVHNDTPNGKDWAWPSGHTSSSFTVASVLDEYYGPKVGIPAYIGAGFVAYRMMDTGDHWASDVVFGAVLGWVVGHTIASRDEKTRIAGFDVLPYMVTDNQASMGVSLMKKF